MKVRVYGTTIGHGSFARVTAGMVEGLTANGSFEDLVSLDDRDANSIGVDSMADVAVLVGHPSFVATMYYLNKDSERLYLLPPNSTWVSEDIVRRVWPYVTGFIAPSMWARDILMSQIKRIIGEEKPVHLWHHGVSAAFIPVESDTSLMRHAYDRGMFLAMHMASTTMARKGTGVLLAAWGKLIADNALGDEPTLVVSVDGPPVTGDSLRAGSRVVHIQRMNLDDYAVAKSYRGFHVVIQPSRGEGFGLIPLEASCCGVPVVATACTGHIDHMEECAGSMIVPHGTMSPIDDGPGAMAPSVSVDDVAWAIEQSYRGWATLSRASVRQSEDRRAQWSWASVTKAWMERIGDQ